MDRLSGAIDMHCHAGPSLFDRDLDYVRAAEEGEAAGMRALVIKDTILSSDLGQINPTHPADGLQSTAQALIEAGISESDVEKLFARNASQLLGYI